MALEIVPLGDCAFVVRVGDSLGEVLAAAAKLQNAAIDGIEEVIPAFASVGVFFRSPPDPAFILGQLHQTLQRRARGSSRLTKPQTLRIPVCYEVQFALDLEEVAEYCGLSPNEVAKRHAAGRYHVRCVGFTPGFPYLSGLPPKLAVPRRQTPRTAVPAGSIAIGGTQTGIYPFASPGGWNIIGRTPLRLFDPGRKPAALLRSGDRIRFVPITVRQFEAWPA